MKNIDISVIILTYNSDFEKTIKTINSILNQKNCSFEIIIADDGSNCNNFETIRKFFENAGYEDYTLIGDGINRGTVKNLYNALSIVNGEFIKPISPGDYLYSENTLYDMMSYQKAEEAQACFGKAVFYSIKNGKYYYLPFRKHPYFQKPYITQNKKEIRDNYLIARDPILGAALLYEKNCLKKSLEVFNGKVKYCEDSVLNLMTAKYQKIVYLQEPVIFYESNTGISSKRHDKWCERIYKDNKYVFLYLLKNNLISENEFYKSFPKRPSQKVLLQLYFYFLRFLKRKLDRRDKIVVKIPKQLFEKMSSITEYNKDLFYDPVSSDSLV